MGELAKLTDIANILTGSSNVQDANETGKYPLFDRSDVAKLSTRYLFDCEAIIVPGEGSEFIPKYYNGKFDLHQRAYAVIPYSGYNAIFLYYIIQNNTYQLVKYSVGTTVKSLRHNSFEHIVVPLFSEKQQAKIAEILTTVDDAIVKTKALIDKYSNIKIGMMQDFFDNRVTTQKLVDFCDSVRDGTHDSPKPTGSSGKYLITSKHLGNQNLDFSCAYKISFEDYEQIIRRSKVDKWDILFSMIGTIGSIYQETNDNPDYAVKNVGLFKMGGNAQKSQWLKYYLQSNLCKKYLSLSLRGSTQKYVSLDVLRKMPIYVPSSDEQQDIINQLEAVDIKITTETNYLSKLQDIKQGLMQDLLKPDGVSVDALL
ncbi:MAG TPA: hypothetical protein DCP51_03250 [Clostridiales bacterium]|nr:MAG: hypothetical protein A2Y40_06460 [Candidatus Margulisbacteria bacterium GWF2_35_9]HAN20683.1 hypothetical protein [Clostridiales bacterium]